MKYSQARRVGALLLGLGALSLYVGLRLLRTDIPVVGVAVTAIGVAASVIALLIIASTRRDAVTTPWRLTGSQLRKPPPVRAPGTDHEITLPVEPQVPTRSDFDEVIDLIDHDPSATRVELHHPAH